MLSDILKKYSNDLLHPLGVFMGRIGIRPNNLTFLGLALTMAAAWQLHAAVILPGVALLLLAGLADGGDGLLARSAGQTSVRGGFLDALTDRYSDSLLFGALLLGGWLAPLPQAPGIPGEAWALAALIGALLTSYARAAAERLGVNQQAVGLVERPERIILLALGLTTGKLAGDPALWATGTLALLALLGNLTVAQRLVHFWQNASEV
ncbi:MAG: CDP-alcohol phosphatidyltransferase family protein [Methanobacteriota archaeon]|uniref:CDP-alcohol phosphatidyltransferase family protein n=1 Tax=Marine Group III euryarchaeote TaxID=2173149 RepID=A0A7C7ZD61_9ARCH|nr:MAG: CDP-alcohol phosphatidyltransferase family protein [Euryarchaeota archaeon]HIG63362.1 CDP-alcohol phosphatidyltransferase family protein [Marine Group III euryarchaeote]HIL33066.1 CDP-alcohol phosphatidyltransferase family protein [Candidatus Poseidoniales archaeon]